LVSGAAASFAALNTRPLGVSVAASVLQTAGILGSVTVRVSPVIPDSVTAAEPDDAPADAEAFDAALALAVAIVVAAEPDADADALAVPLPPPVPASAASAELLTVVGSQPSLPARYFCGVYDAACAAVSVGVFVFEPAPAPVFW
jgi:hypothetical protein